MTNSIHDIVEADVLLVTGSNSTESHPVISLQMKRAVRKHGANLILVDPRHVELADFATLHLSQKPGSDVALFNAMAHVIIAEGLHDRAFVEARTEGFEEFARAMEAWTPQRAEQVSEVPAEQIVAAARLYAGAKKAAIYWAMGITQHTHGTDNVKVLSNLALLTGNVGRPGAGLNPLRGQNNVQGASDMGGLPNVFPGYQPVSSEEMRHKFADAWGFPYERLSPPPGLTLTEMMNGVLEGKIKAIFIVGENPMLSDPDLNHVMEALQKVEFLVVQDIFKNETAEMADVNLPAVSFSEKQGTFTNTERRVQMVQLVLEPQGLERNDWEIVVAVANRLGVSWRYDGPDEIFAEMARLTPQYAGMSHVRLGQGGLQWPCPASDHPGTPYLHSKQVTRGRGLFAIADYRPPAEEAFTEYPLILSTGRMLFHWHEGTMSRRSPELDAMASEAEVGINPAAAKQNAVAKGDMVRVSSRRGEVVTSAKVTRRSPPGTIFMTFHYAEAAANLLTFNAVDPVAKIPEYKVCAVQIQCLNGNGRKPAD